MHFLDNKKMLYISYYIKAYANFARKFLKKTWRDEQKRGNVHNILIFAIIIMSTFVLNFKNKIVKVRKNI